MAMSLRCAASASTNAMQIQSTPNLELYRTNEEEAVTAHNTVNLQKGT